MTRNQHKCENYTIWLVCYHEYFEHIKIMMSKTKQISESPTSTKINSSSLKITTNEQKIN